MTNAQILKKVIRKAKKNGWEDNHPCLKALEKLEIVKDVMKHDWHYAIIFSHDFAEAIWGEKEITRHFTKEKIRVYKKSHINLKEISWKYHLQQMVLEKEPLKYLAKFL